MSRVETIKCDRCGKTIGGLAPCFHIEVELQRSSGVHLIGDRADEEFDLCNECWEEVRATVLNSD